MPFYFSSINGCVYTLDKNNANILLYTPLSSKNTFNGNVETWIEVDFMLMMDEAEANRAEADYALELLSSYAENCLADQWVLIR